MNRNHEAFFRTSEGRAMERILRAHRKGYVLMSLRGEPAIGAAAVALDEALERTPPDRRPFVKQACGALVGDIVQHELGGARAVSATGQAKSARVKDSRYVRTGAVWSIPGQRTDRLAINVRALSEDQAGELIRLLEQVEPSNEAREFDHEMIEEAS